MTATLEDLKMNEVRDHYLRREHVHLQLRCVFNSRAVHDYVQLALGISDPAGNYSAARYGLGPQILGESREEDIFALATEIEQCPNANHLPRLIYDHQLNHIKISVGSEIAMMLKPNDYWVGNARTIWAQLLLRHHGDEERANHQLSLYRSGEWDSEMDYPIWRDIYLALEEPLLQLSSLASQIAQRQGVTPGSLGFLWPDAVASCLYDAFADPHLPTGCR